MKLIRRSSAASMFSLIASTSIMRLMKYAALVTRKEQRYATPPGALLV